ncbi:MAG: acyltransferase [Reyranella sp.]|uniref:acyltransferase family protein n=1 Tax=Reyranella sp. TaxID=1929291 RepID=UPI001AC536A0|nr:acyltransferase [Reyranella sp.]MBN9086646.1 acyltransferase [Reyranella sp.]
MLAGDKSGAGRLAGLDVLRGIAASAVMIHHHAQYYDVLYPGRQVLPVNLEAGHFGVELFFIISGFVILMTIERKGTVRAFAAARATRLLPCFLAALVLATLILCVAPMPPLDTPTVRRFIANLTMAPLLLGERVVDLPYWTLTYEMVFYIAMGVLLALGRLRSVEWIALGWMAVGVAYPLLLDSASHYRVTIILMAYHSNFFVIGMCLYLIHVGRARAVTWLALAAAVAMSARGGGEQAFYASGVLYLSLTVAFATAVWAATTDLGRRMALPPLVFLGRISYPLYLVHVVIGYQVIRLGVDRGWSTTEGVVAAMAVSLAAAALLHYLIEVPGERWSRRTLAPQMATIR